MEQFILKPTDSKNNHPTYKNSFFNMSPAPEYIIGEGIIASMIRYLGWLNDGRRISENEIQKLCGVGPDSFKKVLEKDNNESGKELLKNSDFNSLLEIQLQSPRMKPQVKLKGFNLYPLVPDMVLYSTPVRYRGNPWNPGALIDVILQFGTSNISEYEDLLNKLKSGLSIDKNDDDEDVWARILANEFEARRNKDLTWNQGNVQPSTNTSPYKVLFSGDINIPATQFVQDIKAVLELKNKLTRRQWISILESIFRIGSAAQIMWVCKVNIYVWNLFLEAVEGNVVPSEEIESKVFKENFAFWKYGEKVVGSTKKISREYIISRVGINLMLYYLKDKVPKSITSSMDIRMILEEISENKSILPSAQVLSAKINSMLEKDPKLLNCTKGITSNIFEFTRYSLGQKQTADEIFRSFDQGYWLKKAGTYNSAPWIFEIGPVSILAVAYCCTKPYSYSRTISDFSSHLNRYGIKISNEDVLKSSLGTNMRTLGLITDSPDSEGGMTINNPFIASNN